jgi:hypothetical protein
VGAGTAVLTALADRSAGLRQERCWSPGSAGKSPLASLSPRPGRGRITHRGLIVDGFESLRSRPETLDIDVLYRIDGGDGAIVCPRSQSLQGVDPDGNEHDLNARSAGGRD